MSPCCSILAQKPDTTAPVGRRRGQGVRGCEGPQKVEEGGEAVTTSIVLLFPPSVSILGPSQQWQSHGSEGFFMCPLVWLGPFLPFSKGGSTSHKEQLPPF
jgi:hypothetical protein